MLKERSLLKLFLYPLRVALPDCNDNAIAVSPRYSMKTLAVELDNIAMFCPIPLTRLGFLGLKTELVNPVDLIMLTAKTSPLDR